MNVKIIKRQTPKSICECNNCAKHFPVFNGDVNRNYGQFCSRKCKDVFWTKNGLFNREKNPHWKGGKRIRNNYILIKNREHPFCDSHGYIAEHRLVMEQFLGRFLNPQEVVHHRNEIKSDNRIENLQLFACDSDHRRQNPDHTNQGRKQIYFNCIICNIPTKKRGKYCAHHYWLIKTKLKIRCKATKNYCIHNPK